MVTKWKEDAERDFFDVIKRSWTYDRMTEDEKIRFSRVLNSAPVRDAVTGSYDHRRKVLQAVYESFLLAIGYNGFNWREPEPAPEPWEELHFAREAYLHKVCSPTPFIPRMNY